jgi:signal peptidase I
VRKKYLIEFALITLISVLVFILVVNFFFRPFKVYGESMEPLYSNGDIIFVSRTFSKEFKRGDVVVIKEEDERLAIKRVIAIGGDKIEFIKGEIFVNGKNRGKISSGDFEMVFDDTYFFIEKGKIFVLGENRSKSIDSRIWGAIEEGSVIGKVICGPIRLFERRGLKVG